MKKTYLAPQMEIIVVKTEGLMQNASDGKIHGTVLVDTTTGTASPGPGGGRDDEDVDEDLSKRYSFKIDWGN